MSFLQELEKLTQPATSLPDLEDADFDGDLSTSIKASAFSTNDEEEEPVRRKIQGVALEEDGRYEGEKVSRNDVFGDSSGMNGLADMDGDDDLDGDDENSEENLSDSEGGLASGSEVDEGDDSVLDASSNEDVEDNQEASEDDNISSDEAVSEQNNGVRDIVSTVDKEKEDKKAESVRVQLEMWDQLLYLKIKLQSALRVYNQLPRGAMAKELSRSADDTTKENMKIARKNAQSIILSLLEAEHLLLASSPLTKAIVGEEGGMIDSDDDEIESSEDELDEDEKDPPASDGDECDEANVTDGEEDLPRTKQVFNAKLIEKDLVSRSQKFKSFLDKTLTKWDERTRLTGPRKGKDARRDFSAFEKGGVLQQIEKIMADKSRILKKTQTKRSESDRIGGNPEDDEDPEIFDDDDFYQVLLKEMIDKKTNKSTDPSTMTRHYIEMQKLKSKRAKKRIFDSRLSKDRKIKYVSIPKLVNFHPAKPELIEWTHESRNELFRSLFK